MSETAKLKLLRFRLPDPNAATSCTTSPTARQKFCWPGNDTCTYHIYFATIQECKFVYNKNKKDLKR